MNIQTEVPSLESLEYISCLDEEGKIPEEFKKKIGAYAIFNQEKVLQFVGYSRDISLGLKQSLVCQPQQCCWVKFIIVERPSRTFLEEIQNAWITENGEVPSGNGTSPAKWRDSIEVKGLMTDEEEVLYEKSDDLERGKVLKKVTQRIEAEVKEALKMRGFTMNIRFNPKLKAKGILTLK